MCKRCTLYGSCPIAKQREFMQCEHFKPIRYDSAQLFQIYLKVEDAKQKAKDAEQELQALESLAMNMVFTVGEQPDKDEVLEGFRRLKENRFKD